MELASSSVQSLILHPLAQALVAGILSWLSVTLGAAFIFTRREFSRKAMDCLLGAAGGMMLGAAFFGLLQPAMEMAGHMGRLGFVPVVFGLLLGAVCYLALILWLLKKKKLTVRYSIIWLISAGVLMVFAVFPYVVLVLTDLLGMAVPINVVFILVIAFMLLLLLSLSSIVSGFAEKIKRLAQENALLEERVRRLEAQLAAQDKQTENEKTS